MIWPVLKDLGWDSPDDLGALVIEDGEEFALFLTATIGLADLDGGDLFYVTVISPSKLVAMVDEGPRFLRHHIVSSRFSLDLIKNEIERLCRRCAGEDWGCVGAKLNRFLGWEFEDYRAYETT